MHPLLFSACSIAIVLIAAPAHAYRIVEGKYRVEVAAGVFQDQLVVRCDDGRELALPWETNLREACGERLLRAQQTAAAEEARAPVQAAPRRLAAPVGDFGSGIEIQKRMHLTRLRVQFGEVPEQLITFRQGPDGVSPRFAPQLAEVLDRFEACRNARGTDCVAVRNAAYARIAGSASQTAKPVPTPVRTRDPHPAGATATPQPPRRVRHTAEPRVVREAPGAARPPVAAVGRTVDRSAALREIDHQYRACQRIEPKFECEQARLRALAELDRRGRVKARKPAAPPGQVVHAQQS